MKEIALEDGNIAVQDLVNLAKQGETIILTEAGEPKFVFGTMDEFEREVLSLSRNQEFLDYLESLRARGRVEQPLSLAEARRRLAASDMSGS